jgi:hypothetical protein
MRLHVGGEHFAHGGNTVEKRRDDLRRFVVAAGAALVIAVGAGSCSR